MKSLTLLALFFLSFNLCAHTWDEPWHKTVVSNATTLALYEVVQNKGDSLTLKLKKHIAGEKTKEKIDVSTFHLYGVMSSSSVADHHNFHYEIGQLVYAYLKGSDQGFSIATPTAGIDGILDDGNVAATFRHTLHKTLLEPEQYEIAQQCIFESLHNGSCEQQVITRFIEPLIQRVAVLSPQATKEDYNLFFKQHAALETSYLIGHSLSSELLNPYLESDFFHVQVSAVRALSVSQIPGKQNQLLEYALNQEKEAIARIMAIIMLNEIGAYNQAEELENQLPNLSQEEVSMADNIMDPRIGTWYPSSVKAAAEWFIYQAKAHN